MRVTSAGDADIVSLAPSLAQLPLCQAYGMDEAALRQRLQRALAADAGLVVARRDNCGPPLALAWFDVRGAFATGAYLRLLLVVPEATGRGCGTALLAAFHALAKAPPGGYFALTNLALGTAMGFYTRHGYQQVGVLPDFVRAGHTETLLWRPRGTLSA